MALINPNTPPETREALFDPRFEPTGHNEFRLAALFARQTKADHGWNQEKPRRVIVMENLSPHDIAGIIAAGGEALANTAWNQYNEITDAAWQRDRELRETERDESAGTVPGEFPLVVKTTSDSKHALRFSSEAARDEFVADTVDGEASIMIAEGYGDSYTDQSAEDDAAVDGILARIESPACDQ